MTESSHTTPSFDPSTFRSVLGHFPTGVTIVSAMAAGRPIGLTIGSFTSVSLEPALVGFLPRSDSVTWAAMSAGGSFCVNVLSQEQADLCWTFASSGNELERFDGVRWRPGPTGSPILERSVAWIDCHVERTYEMGDHVFVLGRVASLGVDADSEGEEPHPLLFFRGKLRGFDVPD